MIDTLFLWLLLPLGVALGWALARQHGAVGQAGISTEKFGGLVSHLVSDNPDEALAALTEAAEIDTSTAELHLTLGNLFRKRGEVDRALHIHETLLARPTLPVELRNRTRLELAQDYLKAGLMDRAEDLFLALAEEGQYTVAALEQVRGIYEQGRDWAQAIAIARRVEAAKGESTRALIAQYLCELAEEARARKDPDAALDLAEQAASEDKACIRAQLLLGILYEQAGQSAAAAKAYRRAFEQDPRFLPEVVEPLRRCAEKTGDAAAYLLFLQDAKEMSTSSLPILAEVHLMRAEGLDVSEHLAYGLETRPGRAILAEFLEILEKRPDVVAAGLDKPAASLRGAIRRLMDTTPRYRCSHCGFSPRQLFWQCPSCKQWSTTTPIDDVLKS
jgi:lipopolysaccharide biosynthesis regulator YciM